jgi:hypothetical protein
MIPGPRCCPRSRPPPLTTPSSAVNPAIVLAHVVVRRRQSRRCLPLTPTSSLPTSLSAAAAAAAATTAVSAAIAAAFWLIVVCGPCPVRYPPSSLPLSSRRLMTSFFHRGRRRRTMPTPAEPMLGGHRVVLALPHWHLSPLAATARSLCRHPRCCHPHSPRRRQDDRWRRRQSTTASRRPHHRRQPREEGRLKECSIFALNRLTCSGRNTFCCVR